MNIEEIIKKPITTSGYPDPTEARRYLDDPDGFYGHDYVFLEDATWSALCEISDERGCTVDELCKDADSDDAGRAFRLMSATCSDRSRPAVPIDVGRGGGSPAGRR
jgi:hypothetical protein